MRICITIGIRHDSAMAVNRGTGMCCGARGPMKLQYRNPKGTGFDVECESD